MTIGTRSHLFYDIKSAQNVALDVGGMTLRHIFIYIKICLLTENECYSAHIKYIQTLLILK